MWIVPSRSRPHNVARLLRAFEDTGAVTPVLLGLDSDDPMLGAYPPIESTIGVRRPLSVIYNEAFEKYPDLDWYGIFADDVVPETSGWDIALIEAAGNDGMAWGDDGINGPDHATHFVLGGDLVREIGWLALPGLDRIYIDTVWNDITRGVARYLPDVKITHHHFSNGKVPMDAIYRKHHKDVDREIYTTWRHE